MQHRIFRDVFGKVGILFFLSLFVSLSLGSMTTLAADSSVLNVRIFHVPNHDLPVMEGGKITYFYQIWNTGDIPVSAISVVDNECDSVTYDAVAQDENFDKMLDKGELWSFYCTMIATSTATHTATVSGLVNGSAVSSTDSVTVVVPPSDLANGAGGASDDGGAGAGDPSGVGGANGTSGSAGLADGNIIPNGMPNTGLGGKIIIKPDRKKLIPLKFLHLK